VTVASTVGGNNTEKEAPQRAGLLTKTNQGRQLPKASRSTLKLPRTEQSVRQFVTSCKVRPHTVKEFRF